MTFFLVLLTGAGLVLLVSAMEDVSIADTVRGFVNGQVVTKQTDQATSHTEASPNASRN